MEEKIRIENVTKKFGSYAALDGISLSFEKGKIHGMIGRNGSGKTVLFKCICGFLRVDDGAVLWMENRLGKRSKRRRVLAPSSRHRAFFRATVPDRICSFSPASAGRSEKRRSMRPSEKSDWIRKRKSMSASIRSACASVSALHRRLWKNLLS